MQWWYFPEYLKFINRRIYDVLKLWFEEECQPVAKLRRSALIIYGRRKLGKTMLAWSLT
jgi:AAA+ ATPase superfamily predicted ATPase